MERHTFLKGSAGAVAAFALVGCLDGGEGESEPTETTSTAEAETTNSTESGETSGLPETITIGSDIPYRPFGYETIGGDLIKFGVDITETVFDGQLGIGYGFKPTNFDSIIPSLSNNNFRIIVSAITIDDQRAQRVDFSDPYFIAYQTVIVRQDSDVQSRKDLRGTTAGARKGTTGADAALELQEEFDGELELNRYDQVTDAFQAPVNGQIVAIIDDNTVSAEFVNNQGEGKVRLLQGEGTAAEPGENAPDYLTLTAENYGIAFRQDDDRFRQWVNEALTAIKESGTYDEIYAKYFEG